MEHSITIPKDNVMSEVYKITGYTGSKAGDIDKISSTKDESKILNSYLKEAIGSISDIISAYGVIKETDSECIIDLIMPANWKVAVKDSLITNLSNYLTNFVCLKWFNLTHKEDVEYYNNILKTISANIIKLFCERIRPIR